MAMAKLAKKVVHNAASVTAEDVEPLKNAGVTDAEIFDIVAAAAGRAFFAKLVDALGAEPDAPYLDMEESLRGALTVGRPIDTTQPERLPR